MSKEDVIDVIRESLSIEIERDYINYDKEGIRVKLILDGEIVSSDYVILNLGE